MTSEMRLVAEERLERPEADDLVGDLLEHPDALGAGQGEAFLVDDLAEDLLDLAADLDLVGQVELRVQVLDDPALDPELDVPERLADGRLASSAAARRRRRRRRRRRAGAGRRDAGRRTGAPAPAARSSALDPLQQGHRLTPLLAPRGHCTLLDVIAMRTAISSGRPSCGIVGCRPARSLADHRPGQPQDVLGDLRLPIATGRTARPG